jgi:hypothetical protein
MKKRNFLLVLCLSFSLLSLRANAGCGDWSGFMWTSIDQDVVLREHPTSMFICENTTVYFAVDQATSASNYSLSSGSVSYSYIGSYIVFYMPPGTACTFKVTLTTGGCTYDVYFNFITFDCDWWMGKPGSKTEPKMTTNTEMVPNESMANAAGLAIQKIVITDMNGKIVREQIYPNRSGKINLEGLKSDMYIARLFDGKNWTSKVLKN